MLHFFPTSFSPTFTMVFMLIFLRFSVDQACCADRLVTYVSICYFARAAAVVLLASTPPGHTLGLTSSLVSRLFFIWYLQSAFVQLPGNESVLDADYEANGCEQNPSLLRIRCEALMPRVRLFFQQNHDLSLFHITLSPGNRFLM